MWCIPRLAQAAIFLPSLIGLFAGWTGPSAHAAEPAALQDQSTIVLSPTAHRSGVLWRYTNQEPLDGWESTGFDDLAWHEGEAGFGARTPPGGFVRTDWATKEIWLRRTFLLTNLAWPRLRLLMHHDDDAEIYLNGVRANQVRDYSTAYHEYRVQEEAAQALVLGTNVLAVHCRQDFGAQYIDVGLLSRPQGPAAVGEMAAMEEAPVGVRDWPQFLGPARNATYSGKPLLETWPPTGPPALWSREIGEGYSSPVVAEGKLILCHRLGNDLIVEALDPMTARSLWSFREPMKFTDGARYDNGPRATPAVRDGRVFVFNTDGHLFCLSLSEGRLLWTRRCGSQFNSRGTWSGFVSSPLAVSNAVYLPVGGPGAAVVAFAPETGATLWQHHDDEATAASPVLATLAARPQLLVVTRNFLRSLDPQTGKGLWEYPTHRQGPGTVFGASPAVFGNHVFLSGWYSLGARVLRIRGGGVDKLWSRNDSLSTLYANAIIHRGHAYGFHGHPFEGGGPALRCVDLETGEVRWESRRSAAGTLVRAGERILVLFDSGELQLIAADPSAYKVVATSHVVGRYARSYPAIVEGLVYLRGGKKMVCLDLRQDPNQD
jgi:outer membrane protein assembly factor BamB